MPKFMVTFTNEVDVTVEAESKEEALAAAQDAIDDPASWLNDDPEWDCHAHEISQEKAPDCGVFDGQILEYNDYVAAKAAGKSPLVEE